eukprot:7311047-Prymnesium_polylepis.1
MHPVSQCAVRWHIQLPTASTEAHVRRFATAFACRATLRDGTRVIIVEVELLSTPRMRFERVASLEGWNNETGMST